MGGFLVAAAIPGSRAGDASPASTDEVKKLLGRLDLHRPGLEKVKAASARPAQAAEELLAYYRARATVKHPVDRSMRREVRGKYAGRGDVAVADDALKNILITSGAYPRHDFGPEIDWFTNRSPRKDNAWLWQLHRHSSWHRLAKAYWNTGE